MLTQKIIPAALAAVCQLAWAAPPAVGNQTQLVPIVPPLQAVEPTITLAPAVSIPAGAAAADDAAFMVRSLTITGAQVMTPEKLRSIAQFSPGMMTLTMLRAVAARMTSAYHAAGYVLAQAYLPPQDIRNGEVTIQIREGRYGKIILRNTSGASDRTVGALIGGLHAGDPVTIAALEDNLLLLTDLPGVTVQSTLAPGETAGSADLTLTLTPSAKISGSIDADNAGNRYTGANRVGATVNVNEILGLGDVASLRVLSSFDGLNYARAAYQIQAGKARLGVAFSHLNYRLGEEFEALHARGFSTDATVFGSYALIRSRRANLSAQIAFDDKRYHDRAGDTTRSDKTVHLVTATLSGDARDDLGHGGSNAALVSVGVGSLNLQSADVRALDAITARSNGHFAKINLAASRVQNVTNRFSVFAGANGQIASKNLDVSEKMELGGVNGVRAYPEGESFADSGVIVNLEARYLLPTAALGLRGQAQLFGFLDAGTVTINKSPWDDARNHRTLRGAGFGMRVYDNGNYFINAIYARRLGDAPALSAPDRRGRLWLQAVKYF